MLLSLTELIFAKYDQTSVATCNAYYLTKNSLDYNNWCNALHI